MFALFGLIAGLLQIVAAIPYIRDILRHKTKPQRSSFGIWAMLGAIAFFSQLAKGARWSLFLPAGDFAAVSVGFALSFRYGVGGLSKRDIVSAVVAALGVILWLFTKQPLIALFIIIGIDLIGTALTVAKTYQRPETETLSSWLLASLGGLFAVLAVGKLDWSLLIYPAYAFVAFGSIAVTILLGKSRQHAS